MITPDEIVFAPTYPEPVVMVRLKPCCRAVLDGEDCECAEMAAQMQSAPVVRVGTGWYR